MTKAFITETTKFMYIRTGADLHRFTEIGQIFHKKLIFNNKNFPSWNLENGLDKCFLFPISGNLMSSPPMNQKPGKANFRELVSKKIPGDACPRAPLEACSLGPLFRKSVSIYARSAPEELFVTIIIKFDWCIFHHLLWRVVIGQLAVIGQLH